MIQERSLTVTEADTRGHQRGPNRCFYCGATVGNEHMPECVCRQRTVMVRIEVEMPIEVAESWDAHSIEFYRNESSSCADNVINLMADALKRIEDSSLPTCFCGHTKVTYLREATRADEMEFALNTLDETGTHIAPAGS